MYHLIEYEVSDPLDAEAPVEVGPLRVEQEVGRVVIEVVTRLQIDTDR